MTYKNNAYWELFWNIGSTTTTITIKNSRWGLFPSTFPFYLTLEQLDTATNVVTKREIVSVTNRVWDTFTITRSAWSCPASYTATTQTNTPFAFEDWALVQLRITGEDIDTIKTPLNSKVATTTYNQDRILFVSSLVF